MSLDRALREAIAAIVREEVERALTARGAGVGDGWISVRRAAELADVHPATVRRRIRAGSVGARGSGRHLSLF